MKVVKKDKNGYFYGKIDIKNKFIIKN